MHIGKLVIFPVPISSAVPKTRLATVDLVVKIANRNMYRAI